MRIAFLGSSPFGVPTLTRLAAGHEVVGIVTQPDRPAGRGGRLSPTPAGAWAVEHLPDVPVLKPEKINQPEIVQQIRAWNAEAWVVIAYGQKLGKALLEGVFAINLHASLLPRWRGAAPIQAAMLAGDETTGNCVITLADRMDAGLVLGRTTRRIEPSQTAGELHDLLASDGPDLIEQVLAAHRAGTLSPEVQDESKVTYASKLSPADGWVDFDADARTCRQRINGLSPFPGVRVQFRGETLKLLRAVEVAEARNPPGRSGLLLDGMAGEVACGGGTLMRILEVQAAGKRAMPWNEFANGKKPRTGEAFERTSGS